MVDAKGVMVDRASIRDLFTPGELARLSEPPNRGLLITPANALDHLALTVMAPDVLRLLVSRAEWGGRVAHASAAQTLFGVECRVSPVLPEGTAVFIDRSGNVIGVITGLGR